MSATFEMEGDRVIVRFTEAVTLPGDFDAGAFRMSFSFYHQELERTHYYETGWRLAEYNDTLPNYVVFDLALSGDQEDELLLEFENPIPLDEVCSIEFDGTGGEPVEFCLHYTDDMVDITDFAENPAPALAEHWAIAPDAYYETADGDFPLEPVRIYGCE